MLGAQSLQLPTEGQGWELAHTGDLLALGLPSDSQGHEHKGELNLRLTYLFLGPEPPPFLPSFLDPGKTSSWVAHLTE